MARADRRQLPPGKFRTVNGINWHYEEWGDSGFPLVLVHGYLGSSANWRPAARRLAHSFRVFAVDLPGAGYSDRPVSAPYTLPWFADQLLAFVDSLGLDRPLLGGHSFGGAIAILAAARRPDLARGMVLVAPLAYHQRPPPGLRYAEKYPGLALRFFSSELGKAIIPRLVRKSAYASATTRKSVRVTRLIDHLDAPGGWEAATTMGLAALKDAPAQLELARIRVPVLLAWGHYDRVHNVRCADRMAADFGGPVTVQILEGSAHHAHEEEVKEFVRLISEFVTGIT
jgi:pimeloyl-ACP methyl ester carboxylesterase